MLNVSISYQSLSSNSIGQHCSRYGELYLGLLAVSSFRFSSAGQCAKKLTAPCLHRDGAPVVKRWASIFYPQKISFRITKSIFNESYRHVFLLFAKFKAKSGLVAILALLYVPNSRFDHFLFSFFVHPTERVCVCLSVCGCVCLCLCLCVHVRVCLCIYLLSIAWTSPAYIERFKYRRKKHREMGIE